MDINTLAREGKAVERQLRAEGQEAIDTLTARIVELEARVELEAQLNSKQSEGLLCLASAAERAGVDVPDRLTPEVAEWAFGKFIAAFGG